MSTIGLVVGRHETSDSTAPGGPSQTPGELILTALGAFVKFIPAEVVASYGAFVGVNWTHQEQRANRTPAPDKMIWWISLIACPVLVLLIAWIGNKWAKFGWKLLFAPVGFVLWSASIPHSLWESWSGFKDNQATWVGLVLVLGGAAVAAVGQKVIGDD
jgi:hypothetical protein